MRRLIVVMVLVLTACSGAEGKASSVVYEKVEVVPQECLDALEDADVLLEDMVVALGNYADLVSDLSEGDTNGLGRGLRAFADTDVQGMMDQHEEYADLRARCANGE